MFQMLHTPLLLVWLVSVCGSDIIPPHPSSPRPGAHQLPTRQGSILLPKFIHVFCQMSKKEPTLSFLEPSKCLWSVSDQKYYFTTLQITTSISEYLHIPSYPLFWLILENIDPWHQGLSDHPPPSPARDPEPSPAGPVLLHRRHVLYSSQLQQVQPPTESSRYRL